MTRRKQAQTTSSHPLARRATRYIPLACALAALAAPMLPAQTASPTPVQLAEASLAPPYPTLALPEAPLPQRGGSPATSPGAPAAHNVVPKTDLFIPAGATAQPLTAHDKVVAGAKDLYSLTNFAAMFVSAGYEHALNSQPNYGTDKGAFGQRLGAAAIRESSQTFFQEIVAAPLLHEDPRYYQKGPQFNPARRTIYAVTRTFITRNDSGKPTINGATLLGYAAAAALTPAYYPSSNRNFQDVASVYGGSIGAAALGNFLQEFSTDVFYAFHLKRPER